MAEGGPVHLKEKEKNLDTPPTQQSSEEKAIEAIKHTSKYVKLNIGGSLYYTTLDTLMKQDNMLRAMFSGRLDVKTDEDGKLIHTCILCLNCSKQKELTVPYGNCILILLVTMPHVLSR